MLWLCLLPHHLPLEALSLNRQPEAAVAVTEKHGNRRWIVASTLPLPPGTDWGAALARHPQLRALERNAPAEREALKALAYFAYRFGQPVHLEFQNPALAGELPFHAVWVEVEASLRLFGGLDALLAEVRLALGEQALSCRLGVAPTLEGAALAAQLDDGRPHPHNRHELWTWLQALPLTCLRLPAETLTALRGSGLKRVGELLAIPLDMLARRFDARVLDYLDRLTGRAADPRRAIRPPPRYQRRLELLGEVDSSEALLFPLRRMLQELAGYLRARDTGVENFTLHLHHAELPPTTLDNRLLAPSRSAEHLLLLLRERLERVRLQAPVRELVLHAQHFAAPQAPQLDLFDGARRRDAEWQQLLERLIARFGAEAVFGLGLVADHRPERAYARLGCIPAIHDRARATAASATGTRETPVARPSWLLDPPRPLPRPPALLSSAERVEGGWWDGADVARDYYVAKAQDARLWVFQDRSSGQWYLQGLWA